MPKAAIAALQLDMSAADSSHGHSDSNGGSSSHAAAYSMPWEQLCRSDALAGLEHLALGSDCRDLHTLFPARSDVPCPLSTLPALTSLDVSALALFGNLLRGLPALPQLRELKLQDGDWGLQSARLSVGLLPPSAAARSSRPSTRLQVLSQCRHLTSLHVRLPFLHGARFAACFSEKAPLSASLRHLTLDGFDAASTGWPSASGSRMDRRLEGEPERAKPEGAVSEPAPVGADFAAAFTALVALQSLCLRSVWGIDTMLSGLPCASALRSLRVEPREAPPPSFFAIKELARLAPKLRVSIQGEEGAADDDEQQEGGLGVWS